MNRTIVDLPGCRFAGANLLQAAFTGFCPLAKLLATLGVPYGQAFRGTSGVRPSHG